MEHLDGFQILRKVAESNTAEIFHAVRLAGRTRSGEVALKVLRPAFARSRVERAYLENEYQICSVLDHPSIVRIYEVRMLAERPFLAMDLVPGLSLRQRLDKERPPLAEAIEWLAQVADGLGHCHDRGYLHRDVKPQNIVVADEGPVRMIDFALAIRQDSSWRKYLVRRITEWRRPGTWSYMSPEQIRHKRLTAMVDLYGLGVTLFETTTGRLPYTAKTPQGLLEQHLFAPVPSIRSVRPEVPAELDDLARTMMAKDPLDRPAGMRYVSGKLRSLLAACHNVPS